MVVPSIKKHISLLTSLFPIKNEIQLMVWFSTKQRNVFIVFLVNDFKACHFFT